MDATTSGGGPPSKKRSATTVYALSHDIFCRIFSFLELLDLVRCSGVSKSWYTIISKSKLLQALYYKQQRNSSRLFDTSTSERSLKMLLQEVAMNRHRLSLQEGHIDVFQWKGHSVRLCVYGQQRITIVWTNIPSQIEALWLILILTRTRLLVWLGLVYAFGDAMGKEIYFPHVKACSQRDCACANNIYFIANVHHWNSWPRYKDGYVDPEAVVGCEDGAARVFDMYSRKCTRIIKMHAGPVTCLALSDDQLIVSGSSIGSVTLSDLSSDQRVAAFRSTNSGGVRTLCLNPSSHLVFAGSTEGYASCWDLRTMRTLWNNRVSPNVIYSMNHLRSDKSTLVFGGIDGVLRFLDQETGGVFSRCIMDGSSSMSNSSRELYGVVQIKKAKRLSEDARIDLIPRTSRPPIKCLAVGMQKVVTTHNDRYVRVWKFK